MPAPYAGQFTTPGRFAGKAVLVTGSAQGIGRRVAELFEGTILAEETQRIDFDAAGLPAGTYVVRASGETGFATQTVTHAR